MMRDVGNRSVVPPASGLKLASPTRRSPDADARHSTETPLTKGRRPAPRIVDPASYPTSDVCLRVAAEFLGLNARTVLARIDEGQIDGWRDGKVYRITVSSLVAYAAHRRRLAS